MASPSATAGAHLRMLALLCLIVSYDLSWVVRSSPSVPRIEVFVDVAFPHRMVGCGVAVLLGQGGHLHGSTTTTLAEFSSWPGVILSFSFPFSSSRP